MNNKPKKSTQKMKENQENKLEIARELGINGANNTEVNAKIASQNEPKYSTKTSVKKHNLANDQKTARED